MGTDQPLADERLASSAVESLSRDEASRSSVTGEPNKARSVGALHKRRHGIADRANERASWEAAHPEINLTAERQRYMVEILPRLDATSLPVQALVTALGISTAYASQIRRGVVVPHPMYYSSLERLVTTT
jgi:hypothetical protein